MPAIPLAVAAVTGPLAVAAVTGTDWEKIVPSKWGWLIQLNPLQFHALDGCLCNFADPLQTPFCDRF